MIYLIIIGIAAITGIIAYVYGEILTDSEHIFGWFRYKASELAAKSKVADYLLKPVILCPLCISGQMALWGMLYYMLTQHCYNLPAHVFGICLSILFTHILMKKL